MTYTFKKIKDTVRESKLAHYTESFITKGAQLVSPSRRTLYKIGKR